MDNPVNQPRQAHVVDEVPNDSPAEGGSSVLKLLVGAALGYLLFTNPGARQITADALHAAADALAPEQKSQACEERVQDAVVEKVLEQK